MAVAVLACVCCMGFAQARVSRQMSMRDLVYLLFVSALVTLSRGASPSASHYSVADQELAEPEEITSSSGGNLTTTLTLARWTYSGVNGVSFNTRVYNSRMPGPTLRFKRGDTVKITMINSLEACAHPGIVNELRDPCVTNLHTHGLHVGSNSPADDVLVQIAPGGRFEHTYAILPDHLGGTHWYHPHHHGSTANHVGAGAAGVIIVDDEDSDGLPAEFKDMPEKVIMMQAINTDIAAVDSASGSDWIATGPSAPLLTLNGMTQPRITWEANTWLRLRTVLGSVQHYLIVDIPSDCDAFLLAKDGVWLHNGARQITKAMWAPGNRNDIALRCSAGGPYNLVAGAGRRLREGLEHEALEDSYVRRLQGGDGDGGGGGGAGLELFPAQTIATLYATSSSSAASALPTLTVNYPPYLSTLVNIAADETFDQGVELAGGGGCEFACGEYEHGVVMRYMTVDKVQEFTVEANAHPFHMHINHMQIVAGGETQLAGWHQVGDYVDTFMGSGTVRFKTDKYTGKVVLHCHLLQHEDEGCMAIMEIVDSIKEWGYCLHTSFFPTAAGLLCCLLPLFVSLLVLLLYTCPCMRRQQCPGCCTRVGRVTTSMPFGISGLGLDVACVVVAILPMVNDGQGGLVEKLHRNASDYATMLAISVPCFLIVLLSSGVLICLFIRNVFRAKKAVEDPVGKSID